jgi:hypothetical protein
MEMAQAVDKADMLTASFSQEAVFYVNRINATIGNKITIKEK